MTKIIAEIGLNHMGSPRILDKMIKDLVRNKVYGVTVQILKDNYYNQTRPFRKKIDMKYYQKISKFLKKKSNKIWYSTCRCKNDQRF